MNFHSVIFVEQLKQICMKWSEHTHSEHFWHCVKWFGRFAFIDLYPVPCESFIHNLHYFLYLFLAGNNPAEGFLEVIFLFKITHIFCWTIDVKPLSDLFSIKGVVRFCTNSHPKSNEFTFRGSFFCSKLKLLMHLSDYCQEYIKMLQLSICCFLLCRCNIELFDL